MSHSIANHITIAKVVCLALLFSPLWGLFWFNIDPEIWAGAGHHFVLYTCVQYFRKNVRLGIIYTVVCLFVFVSFVSVTFIHLGVVRLPLMLVMLVGWGFELSILDLNGAVSNQDLLWIMWQEWATAPGAIVSYAPYIIRDWMLILIVGSVLCAAPDDRLSLSGAFGLLPIVSAALVFGVVVYTKGGTQVFPIPFGTLSNTAFVLAKVFNGPRPIGKPLFWDPALLKNVVMNDQAKIDGEVDPVFDKIVMIMDESVRGDYISLNGSDLDTTPFLKNDHDLVNFGVAISSGNCSHIPRTIFRFGMRQSDLPNEWAQGLRRPTIWQFAHRAGYKTVHIDASFHNEMAPVEKAQIDSNVTVFENPGYLRDQKLVNRLLEALTDKKRAFIYVQKYGIHFPYSTKYPPSFCSFRASSELKTWSHRNTIVRSINAAVSSTLPWTSRDDDQEIAVYPNAIAWSVNEFFKKLLPAIHLSSTLIIYTSDHGQSLLPGHFTHCSTTPNVPVSEAYVPLIAITSMPSFKRRLEKGAALGFDRFSHFEMFPTLLLAMGYDNGWVNSTYGPSLLDEPSRPRKFMIGSPGFHPMLITVDEKLRGVSADVGSEIVSI